MNRIGPTVTVPLLLTDFERRTPIQYARLHEVVTLALDRMLMEQCGAKPIQFRLTNFGGDVAAEGPHDGNR